MKKHILLFVISLLGTTLLFAQKQKKEKKEPAPPKTEQEVAVSATDTLPPGEKYGIRFGVDLSKLVRTAVGEDYTGLELVADYRVYKHFYAAAELGNESIIKDEPNINTTTKGTYLRIGGDVNLYDNWYGMQNSIIAGLRYGIASFSQELNSFTVTKDNEGTSVFPPDIRDGDDPQLGKFDGLTASWIELVFGLKTEIASTNIYLSASVSLRRSLKQKQPDSFENLYIPGFGLTNDFGKIGVGYNYTITYLLPFYKKKR